MTIKGQLWDPVVTELYQYVNSLLLTVKSGRVFFFFCLIILDSLQTHGL